MRGKKTSKPGSVLHSAKKPMLLVFSVFTVVSKVRRAVCSVPVKGNNAGRRHTLGSLGRTSASTQSWPHQPQPTSLFHCALKNVNFIYFDQRDFTSKTGVSLLERKVVGKAKIAI